MSDCSRQPFSGRAIDDRHSPSNTGVNAADASASAASRFAKIMNADVRLTRDAAIRRGLAK
jgi:hypothetical protein